MICFESLLADKLCHARLLLPYLPSHYSKGSKVPKKRTSSIANFKKIADKIPVFHFLKRIIEDIFDVIFEVKKSPKLSKSPKKSLKK